MKAAFRPGNCGTNKLRPGIPTTQSLSARRSTLTLPNGIVATYSYDNDSHLTGISYALNSNPVGVLNYGYDALGMRTSVSGSMARTGLPQPIPTASYDGGNELLAWNESVLSYDSNGNMLSDGMHNYAWDARNHLSTIDSGSTGSFVYDPAGRRATKVISGTSTSFLNDLANPVQELSGSTPTANLLTGGLDEYFTRTDASGTSNFLTDALGSTAALTDPTGNIQTQYNFDPFGSTTLSGNSSTNSFAYTGREKDGTGLYYNRARYYSPTVQRFVSEDPLGFASGDFDFYSYVGNNPVNRIDPYGMYGMFGRSCGAKDCRNYFLKHAYGPIGNFLANTAVPSFSSVSIFTNTWSWLQGEGLTLLAKGALSGGPMLYGRLMTLTGTNLLQYSGQAAAASEALTQGAIVTTGGALAGQALLFIGVEGSVFSTTADLYSRWVCRNVQ